MMRGGDRAGTPPPSICVSPLLHGWSLRGTHTHEFRGWEGSLTRAPFSPLLPGNPGKPCDPWGWRGVGVRGDGGGVGHVGQPHSCQTYLGTLTARVAGQAWHSQLPLWDTDMTGGVSRGAHRGLHWPRGNGMPSPHPSPPRPCPLTFSPTSPMGPGSPVGPVRPLGPSGPSSPREPGTPTSPCGRCRGGGHQGGLTRAAALGGDVREPHPHPAHLPGLL